tara:strand:+ start:15646 stop:16242 length:597 start_codon:yes stop_codon:yes gene_type:complete
MSSVFSAADKWEEPWHSKLSKRSKLLYDYLYDTADNAGFKGVNFSVWSGYTGLSETEIKSSLDELKEVVIIENDVAWLKDHIRYNRNEHINAKTNPMEKVRKAFLVNRNHKKAFALFSSLVDSDLLSSSEPLNQGLNQGLNHEDAKYAFCRGCGKKHRYEYKFQLDKTSCCDVGFSKSPITKNGINESYTQVDATTKS